MRSVSGSRKRFVSAAVLLVVLIFLPFIAWSSLTGSTTEVEVVRNLSGPRFEPTVALLPGVSVTQNIAPSNQGLDRRRTVLPILRDGADLELCVSIDFSTGGVVNQGLIALQVDGPDGRLVRALLLTEGIRDGVPFETCFEKVGDLFPLRRVHLEGLELRSGPGVAPMSRDLPFMARAGDFGTLEYSGQALDDRGLSFIIRVRSDQSVSTRAFLPLAWTPLALILVLFARRHREHGRG